MFGNPNMLQCSWFGSPTYLAKRAVTLRIERSHHAAYFNGANIFPSCELGGRRYVSASLKPRRRIFSQRVVRPIPSSFDAAPTSPLVAASARRM